MANQHSSTIVDSSAASARSGVSVALVPTPGGGVAAPSGVTAAHSGTTSATGITAANAVSNTALQAVSVGGANEAPVSLTSQSNIVVQDTGAAGANTGAGWAVAAGVAGGPGGVATPSVAGAAPTSAAMSATGLQAHTDLRNATSANVNVDGGPAETGPISIAPTLVANVTAGGAAAAVSGAACSGATCPAGASTSAGVSQATSGAASAQGLVAQNTVNTNADVVVKVSGGNFAPIKVVVDSITQIFNWGVASATSGDTTAAGSGSTVAQTTGQMASSGSASATGAQVQNNVDLRSSATVKVTGDNYNPINIMLNLAASLRNWGVGLASSGDAQANGGGGIASSGASNATGLQVLNLVNMWAFASVDIEGNNYAPILIEIHFKTNIDNRGYAGASTGIVAAGQAAASGAGAPNAPSTTSTTSATGTTSGGGSRNRARGGDAVAISNSVDAGITSTQISSANGSKPITSAAITQMLRNLPPGDWSPFVDPSLPQAPALPVFTGADSTSGNSTAVGLHSSIGQTNTQIAACSDPGVSCLAANSASISTTVRDLPRNPATVDDHGDPGPGGTISQSEFAGINATPTPMPTRTPTASVARDNRSGNSGNGGGGSNRRGTTRQFAVRNLGTEPVADGQLVLVDLWDQWPGRRLPPMPNPLARTPISTSVDVSLDGWPGADELPMPGPGVASLTDPRPAAAGLSRRPASGSHDVAVDSEQIDDYPPLAIVDVNPWTGWPGVQPLPMPLQTPPAPAVAGEQTPRPDTTPAPPDADVTPVEFGLAAVLSAVLGGLVGLRRGRGLAATVLMRFMDPFGNLPRFNWPWLGRQTARGLALLRLTLGMLRLW